MFYYYFFFSGSVARGNGCQPDMYVTQSSASQAFHVVTVEGQTT